MGFRSIASHVSSFLALFATLTLVSYAQLGRAQSDSASQIMAELTNGKLNPANSKTGDTVFVRLKEDVRSNGEVILKKGTTITAVVRNVKRVDVKGEWKAQGQAQFQSMIEIEWLVPPVQARSVQGLSFALQSVSQINPIYEHSVSSDDAGLAGIGKTSSLAARSVRNTGALLDSPSNGATVLPTTAADNAEPAPAVSGRSNVALLSMPSVVAVDQQTSAMIENALGLQTSGQLFRVGHNPFASAGGSKQALDLYSHLNNDTVIASPNSGFEISSGAQMQMLVGVNRK
jgi:hypothetical protein